jgi:hypothetical protein
LEPCCGGGPTYSYRSARIERALGGHVCGLFMPEHPLHGRNFGVVGTVTSLVDLWAIPVGCRVTCGRGEGARHDRGRGEACRAACMRRHGQPELGGIAQCSKCMLPERRTGRGPCPDALPPDFRSVHGLCPPRLSVTADPDSIGSDGSACGAAGAATGSQDVARHARCTAGGAAAVLAQVDRMSSRIVSISSTT